jgi:hypothetical protein
MPGMHQHRVPCSGSEDENGRRMRLVGAKTDGAVVPSILRRQRVASLPNPQMPVFSVHGIIARTDALADMT